MDSHHDIYLSQFKKGIKMYHASCMLFYVRLVCYPLKIIFQTDPDW